MRFLPTILVVLLLAIAAGTFAHPGDKEKKKKKKKGGETTQTSKLDKSAQQKLERLFLEAEKAKVIEDWDNAIKSYNEVLATDPDNANAHFS